MKRIIQQSKNGFKELIIYAIIASISFFGIQGVYAQDWELKQIIDPVEISNEYYFGMDIAISGHHMLIGAPGSNAYGGYGESGKIYNYQLQADDSWELLGLIDVENLFGIKRIGFGSAVELEGDIAVVRIRSNQIFRENNGVFIFEYKEGSWKQVKAIAHTSGVSIPGLDVLPSAIFDVAISGNRIVLGSQTDNTYGDNSGCVYIYEKEENGSWEQVDKLFSANPVANTFFGSSVDISGDAIIVSSGIKDGGPYKNKYVHIFEKKSTGTWEEVIVFSSEVDPDDGFGTAIAIDGDRAVVSAVSNDPFDEREGYLTILERNELGEWMRTILEATPNEEIYGSFVDLEGDIVVAGAWASSDETAVVLFEKDENGQWRGKTLLSEDRPDYIGVAPHPVSISNQRVFIGSVFNEFREDYTGIAYLYEKTLPSCTVVNTNDDGPGSLRDLVDNHPECDTIFFDPSLAGKTIELTSGQIHVDRNVVIWGQTNGSITEVSGGEQSRIFEIGEGNIVEIHRTGFIDGKAISEGGAILNHGVLKVVFCTFHSCETVSAEGSQLASGGAIQNKASLDMRGSILTFNKARSGGAINNYPGSSFYGEGLHLIYNTANLFGGAGIYNASNTQTELHKTRFFKNSTLLRGGAIFNQGNFKLVDCEFEQNEAQQGGAIYNSRSSGKVEITKTSLINNKASQLGGGIYNEIGELKLEASTFYGENEAFQGGAIYNKGGKFFLLNTTISGNLANNGAGIYNNETGMGYAKFTTIVLNLAELGQSTTPQGGGIYNEGYFESVNTIVASNLREGMNLDKMPNDVYGKLQSGGHNLIGVDDFGFDSAIGDLYGNLDQPLDPLLEPLGDYGGPTHTHALQLCSPAVDAGIELQNILVDQRGYMRILGNPDIGAYEWGVNGISIGERIVTTLEDGVEGSLRTIIETANPGDKIVFASNVEGVILLKYELGEILINKPITIVGPGAHNLMLRMSLEEGQEARVLHIASCVKVAISGLGFSGGSAPKGGEAPHYFTRGGGIFNQGELDLEQVVVTANKAATLGQGGGICNDEMGILNLRESSIYDNNSSSFGGGVFNIGEMHIVNTTIAKNKVDTSPAEGGGIFNGGVMYVDFSTIAYNETHLMAWADGAGIYNSKTLYLGNSILAHNSQMMEGDVIPIDIYSESQGIHDLGYNLISDDSDVGLSEANNNLLHTDPLLGEFVPDDHVPPYYTLNGWETSPCIEAANPVGAPAVDQRGIDRPSPAGTVPDIGAYEFVLPLEVQSLDSEAKLLAYPNPTESGIWVYWENDQLTSFQLAIRNQMGQLILTEDWKGEKKWLDMSKYSAGIYYISLIEKGGKSLRSLKIIKR